MLALEEQAGFGVKGEIFSLHSIVSQLLWMAVMEKSRY